LQLSTSKTDLKKSQDELVKVNKEFESTKTELKKMKDCKVKLDETQKQMDALKKKSTDVESEVIASILRACRISAINVNIRVLLYVVTPSCFSFLLLTY